VRSYSFIGSVKDRSLAGLRGVAVAASVNKLRTIRLRDFEITSSREHAACQSYSNRFWISGGNIDLARYRSLASISHAISLMAYVANEIK